MNGAQQVLSLPQAHKVVFGFMELMSVVLQDKSTVSYGHQDPVVLVQNIAQKHLQQLPCGSETLSSEREAVRTCMMSLCLCKVCINAALCDDVPGLFVYSAIWSLTAVSCRKKDRKFKSTSRKHRCNDF